MGYTTEFLGEISVNGTPRKLDEFNDEMNKLYETRHGGNTQVWDGYPSFYCQWVFDRKSCVIRWDGNEKFYDYVDWMKLVCKVAAQHCLSLNGEIKWRGEEFSDMGKIVVVNNVLSVENW